MGCVYEPDNFAGRVAYAAAVISRGGRTSRTFDTCFEMYDGEAVAVALLRRAERSPKIAANLFRYVCEKSTTEAAARLVGKNMTEHARRLRTGRAAA
jgi:hypothetical protein